MDDRVEYDLDIAKNGDVFTYIGKLPNTSRIQSSGGGRIFRVTERFHENAPPPGLEDCPPPSGEMNKALTSDIELFIDGGELIVGHDGSQQSGWTYRYTSGRLTLNNSSGTVIDSSSAFWPETNGPYFVTWHGPITINAPRSVTYLGMTDAGSLVTLNAPVTVETSFYAQGPVTNAYNLLINGFVTIDCKGSFDSSPLYGSNATLSYVGGECAQNVGYEWASGTTVGRGIPKNVQIGVSNYVVSPLNRTIIMPGEARRCPGNLVIGVGDTLELSTTPGADLNVGGNWTVNPGSFGGSGVLIPNSRQVVFDGTTEQFLYGLTAFDNLTINNTDGLSRGSFYYDTTRVNETLHFIAGSLRPKYYPLVLLGNVVGASVSSHVVSPNPSSSVMRRISATESFQFPVGDSDSTYNPVTIELAPGDPSETFSVSVSAEFIEPDYESRGLMRQWYIFEKTPGGNNTKLTFQWETDDPAGSQFNPDSGVAVFWYDGSQSKWIETPATYEAGPPHRATATITGFVGGTFGIGNAGPMTSVAEKEEVPTAFELSQNYPNPFNPSTTLQYAIPRSGRVTLKICNLLGNEVATLVDEKQQAGKYDVQWNPVGLPSGVYFYRLEAEGFAQTKKLLLMK